MSSRVRVGMNLLWLRPGVVGGSEVAATATVAALLRRAAEDVDLVLYAQPSFVTAHPELAAAAPTRTVDVPGDHRGVRVALENSWLPRAARRDRVEVVHAYGGVVPPGLSHPSVLTLHDLQPLESGAAFGPVKTRWLRRMIPASVARARVVAVPSKFVRARTLELLGAGPDGVDPDKVVVVPHGPGAADQRDPATLPTPEAIRRRFRLAGPIVLYPAITYPHKNHATLLRAFAGLWAARPDTTLVLTGGAGPAEPAVTRLAEELGIGAAVRRVGRVAAAERDALVRDAAVVAMPSRYEGFGLPVLEALAADTPVVAAELGALPEVVGDAGTLVDPDDVAGWTAALADAIDHGRSQGATTRRAAQVATMTWDQAAARLVELYRRTAHGGGHTGGTGR